MRTQKNKMKKQPRQLNKLERIKLGDLKPWRKNPEKTYFWFNQPKEQN